MPKSCWKKDTTQWWCSHGHTMNLTCIQKFPILLSESFVSTKLAILSLEFPAGGLTDHE